MYKNFIKKTVLLLLITTVLSCNSTKKNTNNTKENSGVTTLEQKKENLSKLPESLRNSILFSTKVVEPTQLFDNIYFVGYEGIGAFVINTADGIILIDAMWTNDDAKNVIVPGIEKLGLDPKNIKYLIVTHEHADHFGGASYFENTYNIKVLMSKIAWEGLHDPNARVLTDPFGNKSDKLPLPKTYQEIKDKEIVSLGKTNIEVLLTPGHTKGAISLLISTTDFNTPITVGIWGGTGLPMTLEDNEAYLNSLNYFEAVAVNKNVNSQISNHPFVNGLLDKMDILRSRKPNEPNPLIVDIETFKKNIDTSLRKNVAEKIASFK